MTAPAIETENLTKEYPHGFLNLKKRNSLEGLNMQVETGEIFGFIGPNGAGKTTTIKLLMRLIFPRSEEHTSELQSQSNLVCRLLLEKKKSRRARARDRPGQRHGGSDAPRR